MKPRSMSGYTQAHASGYAQSHAGAYKQRSMAKYRKRRSRADDKEEPECACAKDMVDAKWKTAGIAGGVSALVLLLIVLYMMFSGKKKSK